MAPVTEKAAATRKVYLPPDAWYDFWTAAKLEGGKEISRNVDLETMRFTCARALSSPSAR